MNLSEVILARIPVRSFLSEFISTTLQNIALCGFGYWGYQRFYLATWAVFDCDQKTLFNLQQGHACFGQTPYWATFRYVECLFDVCHAFERDFPERSLEIFDVRLIHVQEIDGRSYEFIKTLHGHPLRKGLGLVLRLAE